MTTTDKVLLGVAVFVLAAALIRAGYGIAAWYTDWRHDREDQDRPA